MRDGTEPINPDEPIYRRVAVKSGFCKPTALPAPVLSPKAFNPIDGNDEDGISFHRGVHLAGPEAAAALGAAGKSYYIIELRAGDIQREGIVLIPDPIPNDPSHAIIPEINSIQRETTEVKEKMERIRNLPLKIHGPFPGAAIK